MNILASEKQKRSTASAPVGESVVRPAPVSFIKSIIRIVLATLCCSFFAVGPAHGQSDGTDAQSAAMQKLASPATLASGTYEGIWRDEDGLTGACLTVLKIDGQSISGKLTVFGVDKYSLKLTFTQEVFRAGQLPRRSRLHADNGRHWRNGVFAWHMRSQAIGVIAPLTACEKA